MPTKTKLIPVEALFVDRKPPAVQRPEPSPAALRKLTNNWSDLPELVLHVSERVDLLGEGRFHIIDGQHRWMAAKLLNIPRLRCIVYNGLSRKEEADLFLVLNNTKNVSAMDRWCARITARDPAVLGVINCMRSLGWTVGRSPGNTQTNAVIALEHCWDLDETGDALARGVDILLEAYGRERDGNNDHMSGLLIEAAARYIYLSEDTRAVTSIARAMTRRNSKVSSPTKWLNNARTLASMSNGTAIKEFALSLLSERLKTRSKTGV